MDSKQGPEDEREFGKNSLTITSTMVENKLMKVSRMREGNRARIKRP